MARDIIHDRPSDVESAPNEVLVSGPDGVAVSMTPEAAAKTGEKLLESAAAARGKAELEADLAKRRDRNAAQG